MGLHGPKHTSSFTSRKYFNFLIEQSSDDVSKLQEEEEEVKKTKQRSEEEKKNELEERACWRWE